MQTKVRAILTIKKKNYYEDFGFKSRETGSLDFLNFRQIRI